MLMASKLPLKFLCSLMSCFITRWAYHAYCVKRINVFMVLSTSLSPLTTECEGLLRAPHVYSVRFSMMLYFLLPPQVLAMHTYHLYNPLKSDNDVGCAIIKSLCSIWFLVIKLSACECLHESSFYFHLLPIFHLASGNTLWMTNKYRVCIVPKMKFLCLQLMV